MRAGSARRARVLDRHGGGLDPCSTARAYARVDSKGGREGVPGLCPALALRDLVSPFLVQTQGFRVSDSNGGLTKPNARAADLTNQLKAMRFASPFSQSPEMSVVVLLPLSTNGCPCLRMAAPIRKRRDGNTNRSTAPALSPWLLSPRRPVWKPILDLLKVFRF